MCKRLLMGVIMASAFVVLAACGPSDSYGGDWYALSQDGNQVKINFSEDKTMTIAAEGSEGTQYDITQTAAGFQNSVGYYRVEIEERPHYVVFEDRKDESTAILVQQTNVASDFEDMTGEIIYAMNRDDFPEKLR